MKQRFFWLKQAATIAAALAVVVAGILLNGDTRPACTPDTPDRAALTGQCEVEKLSAMIEDKITEIEKKVEEVEGFYHSIDIRDPRDNAVAAALQERFGAFRSRCDGYFEAAGIPDVQTWRLCLDGPLAPPDAHYTAICTRAQESGEMTPLLSRNCTLHAAATVMYDEGGQDA